MASLMDELSPDIKLMVYADSDEEEVHDELDTSMQKKTAKFISLNRELEKANRINPSPEAYDNLSLADQVLMIYTSGTTGMPKAAKISGYRVHYMGWGPAYLNRWSRGNIFYTPLPLFHSSAGGLILGQMLWKGRTVVIRRHFSVSHFWSDVAKYKVTAINYIGETARFLLRAPYNQHERDHCVRFAVGNGMSSQIWRDFQTRFNIGTINEFYASTEGNCNVMNPTGHPLSCGFLPCGPARAMFPVNVFRLDSTTGELARDERGLCIPVKSGEVGMIMGKVRNDFLSRFDGYHRGDESRRKLTENVFAHGDKEYGVCVCVVFCFVVTVTYEAEYRRPSDFDLRNTSKAVSVLICRVISVSQFCYVNLFYLMTLKTWNKEGWRTLNS